MIPVGGYNKLIDGLLNDVSVNVILIFWNRTLLGEEYS